MTDSAFDVRPYLEMMIRVQASDLFLSAGAQVKIKIDGVVRPVGGLVLNPALCRTAVASVMNEAQMRQLETERELDFAITLSDRGRFRVNAFYQRGTPSLVLRYIPGKIPTAEELRLPPILTDLVMRKRGILLMVGATGSGKTTTLAALVDFRNKHSTGHILTIEDPIEFVHSHGQCVVNQREVGSDTKSYATALKSSLREAPDVILIGEIRAREAMEAAIELSGTGHLAISTLHANNAAQAMERIVNMFPHELHRTLFTDLALNMRAIVSQRLVRDVDGKRCAAVEVLVNTPHIADLIHAGRLDEVQRAMQESGESGMKTFDDALLELYRAGVVSLDEALANADSAANLDARVHFS